VVTEDAVPRAVPPQASTDCTAPTDRALPYPPADGIPARRQARVFPSLAWIAGLAGPLKAVPFPSVPIVRLVGLALSLGAEQWSELVNCAGFASAMTCSGSWQDA
jgi:hypothetical protein